MSRRDLGPRLLDADHGSDGYSRRSAEQTEWLRRHARQAHSSGAARVLVVTEVESADVVPLRALADE